MSYFSCFSLSHHLIHIYYITTIMSILHLSHLETSLTFLSFLLMQGLNVPRSRFLPVKKTDDLLLVMSNLYRLQQGTLIMSPLRMFETTPLVKLGPNHFGRVKVSLGRVSGNAFYCVGFIFVLGVVCMEQREVEWGDSCYGRDGECRLSDCNIMGVKFVPGDQDKWNNMQ